MALPRKSFKQCIDSSSNPRLSIWHNALITHIIAATSNFSNFTDKSDGKFFETVAAEVATNALQMVPSDLPHLNHSREEGVFVSRVMLRISQTDKLQSSQPLHIEQVKAAYEGLLTWLLSEDIQTQLSLTSTMTKWYIKKQIEQLHTKLSSNSGGLSKQVVDNYTELTTQKMPSEDEHTVTLNSYFDVVTTYIKHSINHHSTTSFVDDREKAIQAVLAVVKPFIADRTKSMKALLQAVKSIDMLEEVARCLDCCYSLKGQLSESDAIKALANLQANINLLQARNDPALSTLIKALNQFVDAVEEDEEERFDAVTKKLQKAITELPNEDLRKVAAQEVLDEARSIKSSLVASSDLSKVTNCLCKVASKLSNKWDQQNSNSQDSIEERAKQKNSLSTIRVADKFAAKLSIFIGVCALLGGAAIGVAAVMGGLVVPGMFAMVIPSAALIGAGIWMIKEGCKRLKNPEAEAQKIPSSHPFLKSVDRFFQPKAVEKEKTELAGGLNLMSPQF